MINFKIIIIIIIMIWLYL